MTLRTVHVYVDGVEVGQGTIDIEPLALSTLHQLSGELRCELDADQWACITEHSVFSLGPGKP